MISGDLAVTDYDDLLRSFERDDLSIQDKVMSLLERGRELFGLDVAILSKIQSNKYTTLFCMPTNANLYPGKQFELGETYCSFVMTSSTVRSFHQAGKEIATHPCYRTFALESYIGAPVIVSERVFGTLNFPAPRHVPNRSPTMKY